MNALFIAFGQSAFIPRVTVPVWGDALTSMIRRSKVSVRMHGVAGDDECVERDVLKMVSPIYWHTSPSSRSAMLTLLPPAMVVRIGQAEARRSHVGVWLFTGIV